MHMRLEGDCVPPYRRIFCEMWERCTDHKIDSLEYQPDSLAIQIDFRGLKENSLRGFFRHSFRRGQP